jgi:integrase
MPTYKYGSGSVYKRGRIWWLSYYPPDGRHVCESARTKDRGEARSLLHQRLGQIAEGRYRGPQADRVTFQDLAALVVSDYAVNGKRSRPDLERRLRKHVLPVFGQRRAQSITAEDVKQFIIHRQEAGASHAEINRELAIMKRAFTLGLQSEIITRKPHIPSLTERNARAGFFEHPHFERLLVHLPEHLRPSITFAFYTGWRLRSEILPLAWGQVDLEQGTVRLHPHSTKNDEGRVIQLPHVLLSILAEQWRHRPEGCPWVFPYQGKRLSYPYHAWRKAIVAAGLEGKIPHDFRRTAVRNLVRIGVPERVAMTICGHKTRAVFDRYTIVSPGDLAEAARRIDEDISRQQQPLAATFLATASTSQPETHS